MDKAQMTDMILTGVQALQQAGQAPVSEQGTALAADPQGLEESRHYTVCTMDGQSLSFELPAGTPEDLRAALDQKVSATLPADDRMTAPQSTRPKT